MPSSAGASDHGVSIAAWLFLRNSRRALGARLDEHVAELRRTAAGRDADGQLDAHALQAAVVRPRDRVLALGQWSRQHDRGRERVVLRVRSSRRCARVDLRRVRVAGAADAVGHELDEAELRLDAAGDRDVMADVGRRGFAGRAMPATNSALDVVAPAGRAWRSAPRCPSRP